MPLDRYMALCLGHPLHGYYTSRDPFGLDGDFITAPEISQIFGELVGIWCAAAFQMLGAPALFNLIELGPGRGTLMSDIMRATRVMPGFREAAQLHLVETSPTLRKLQAEKLGSAATWHESIDSVPVGPSIIIANEFFDALPVCQYEFHQGHWMERRVGLSADDRLVIGRTAVPLDRAPASEGTIFETGTHARCRCSSPGRPPRAIARRRPHLRLRPRESHSRRHAASGPSPRFLQHPRSPGRGRPHVACRFRQSRSGDDAWRRRSSIGS